MTTDNASNFVKSFTQFQHRGESGLIQMVMEEEVDESEKTTTGDDLPVGEEEEEEEDEEGDSDTDSVRVRREEEARRRSKKKKGTAEDPEDINIELEDQQEPSIVEATEILDFVTNKGKKRLKSNK